MIRRLYLFDDDVARSWVPFSLTGPAGELRFGALLIRERLERAVGLSAAGYLVTRGLEGFEEDAAPSGIDFADLPRDVDRIVLSSRYLPPLSQDGGAVPTLRFPSDIPPGGLRLRVDGQTVGWILPAQEVPPRGLDLLHPDHAATGDQDAVLDLPGKIISHPWQFISELPDQLRMDLDCLYPEGHGPDVRPLPAELPGVHRLGRGFVSAGEDVRVDPGVVLDTRDGPIHLSSGARVRPFTHLQGPALIGRNSILFGGTYHAFTCGPVCKLRGEIDTSVILGYSNKAHDGYLGHSLVGRWVNLGAFTTNSDLKNNYGAVRVAREDGVLDSGLLKLGVFIGDHVKTGIGTLLNAGTVVGAGANIFGSAPHPKWIPPFAWGSGGAYAVYELEAFLTSTEKAMARRRVPLTPGQQVFLSRLWGAVHPPTE